MIIFPFYFLLLYFELNLENDEDSEDSDEDSENEEDEGKMTLPITSNIKLDHGTKPISSLALDPSGARLLTGGDDYNLKFWDFPGEYFSYFIGNIRYFRYDTNIGTLPVYGASRRISYTRFILFRHRR